MKLGVFDSGVGGEAIAISLQTNFPSAKITTVNDRTHIPYGNKSADEIRQLTDEAIQPLLGSDVIIIACNSATAAAIDWLRKKYVGQKFIGIEPMVKSAAAATKTGVIAVCATPATLKSERYRSLKDTFASHLSVVEPDCSNWAELIEDNLINEQHIDQMIQACIGRGADVIVLGCTHYHWIKEEIVNAVSGKAVVLEPSEAIGLRVKELLGHNASTAAIN
jgi:glutamate racemase